MFQTPLGCTGFAGRILAEGKTQSHREMWGSEPSFRHGTGCQRCSGSPAGDHSSAGVECCGTHCSPEFSPPRLVHQVSIASWVKTGQVKKVSHYSWHGAMGKCNPWAAASLHRGISEIKSYASQETSLKLAFTSRLTELWAKSGKCQCQAGTDLAVLVFCVCQVNLG